MPCRGSFDPPNHFHTFRQGFCCVAGQQEAKKIQTRGFKLQIIKSKTENWDVEISSPDMLRSAGGGGRRGGGGGGTADIKSNHPHLTGGGKNTDQTIPHQLK